MVKQKYVNYKNVLVLLAKKNLILLWTISLTFLTTYLINFFVFKFLYSHNHTKDNKNQPMLYNLMCFLLLNKILNFLI